MRPAHHCALVSWLLAASLALAACEKPAVRPPPAPAADTDVVAASASATATAAPAPTLTDDSPIALAKLEQHYGKPSAVTLGKPDGKGGQHSDMLIWHNHPKLVLSATRQAGVIERAEFTKHPFKNELLDKEALFASFGEGQPWHQQGTTAPPRDSDVLLRTDGTLYALASSWDITFTTPAYFKKSYANFTPEAGSKPVVRAPESAPSATPASASTAAAKWPAMSDELRGSMEVRVRNPNDFSVKVGLRSGGKDKDFAVTANGAKSVTVPNGDYDIYFQYSTDPDGLYQGDSFTLRNNGVEIQIVKVFNGNYGIRKVN